MDMYRGWGEVRRTSCPAHVFGRAPSFCKQCDTAAGCLQHANQTTRLKRVHTGEAPPFHYTAREIPQGTNTPQRHPPPHLHFKLRHSARALHHQLAILPNAGRRPHPHPRAAALGRHGRFRLDAAVSSSSRSRRRAPSLLGLGGLDVVAVDVLDAVSTIPATLSLGRRAPFALTGGLGSWKQNGRGGGVEES